MKKKIMVVLLAFLGVLMGCQFIPGSPSEGLYPVTRVVDGDTIKVLVNNQEETVRYIGIDTPETVHPSKPVEFMGAEASKMNKDLIMTSGGVVRLELDIQEKDKYGRYLAYVYAGETFINYELVRLGYARVATYPPNVKHSLDFIRAEKEARENNRGLWSE